LPFTARDQFEQGLDDAVSSAAAQSEQAKAIATPPPSGAVGSQLAAVMSDRSAATVQLRSTIDGLLGMTPLPVAGSPSSAEVVPAGPLISANAASVALGAAGTAFEDADARYRAVLSAIRRQHYRIRLPASAWVSTPQSAAPLGTVQLAAIAPVLAASVALSPFHHLVVSAVGLEPPAVPGPGPGVIGVSCGNAISTPPGASPSVVPPTPTLTVKATVTNCGTVAETGIAVTTSVALDDPVGTALPPVGARGGTRIMPVTLRSGGATALTFGPFSVANGHQYLVTVSIAIPVGQQGQPQGSTQQILVQITG
jgi:hypothetical protein